MYVIENKKLIVSLKRKKLLCFGEFLCYNSGAAVN